MKLTAMSKEVFEYLKANGDVSIDEMVNALGRGARSIGANVTDLQKKGFVIRDKRDVEGAEKPVTYVVMTDEGKSAEIDED